MPNFNATPFYGSVISAIRPLFSDYLAIEPIEGKLNGVSRMMWVPYLRRSFPKNLVVGTSSFGGALVIKPLERWIRLRQHQHPERKHPHERSGNKLHPSAKASIVAPSLTSVQTYFRTAIREISTGKIVKVSQPISLSKYPFRIADPDGRLWRYGDYWKMKGLLISGEMYFRRSDRLQDVKEGRFTKANLAGASLLSESLGFAGSNAKIIEIQESLRCRTFLSCWHRNQSENPLMWSSYTTVPEAIAISSGTPGLRRAVEGRCEAFDVNYIGDNDPIPDFHSLSVFAHKRRDPFEFEREFRLAYMLPAEESVWLDKEEDFGRIIKVDPRGFIDEVRFHPDATDAFRTRVQEDLASVGFSVVVRNAESPPLSKN